ncbi:unnamed protein product [Durusdinium trenchii]|uniref:DUF4166 domain-containing protein n=2 Tax=Durusdinium trenchii TaxID=1381693 RepID=A0ABP0R0Y3_9DINO
MAPSFSTTIFPGFAALPWLLLGSWTFVGTWLEGRGQNVFGGLQQLGLCHPRAMYFLLTKEHHWNPKLQVFQALPPFSNVPHDQVRFGPILPWGLCEGMLGRFPVNATRITRKMKARGRAITWQAGHIALWFMRGPLMDAIFSASADRDPGPFFGLGASMVVFGVEVKRPTERGPEDA